MSSSFIDNRVPKGNLETMQTGERVHSQHFIKGGIHLLAAGLLTLASCPAAAQETSPSQPAAPSIKSLGFHFESQRRRFSPQEVIKITKEEVTFDMRDARSQVETEHPKTFRLGSILPDSDYVIISLSPKRETKDGISRDMSVIGLKDSQTGHVFTFVFGDVEADRTILRYNVELVRDDGSRLRPGEGETFDSLSNPPTKYKVVAIELRGVSVQRLSDGSVFRVALSPSNYNHD